MSSADLVFTQRHDVEQQGESGLDSSHPQMAILPNYGVRKKF
jgi:hypothetical protein